MSQDTRSFLPLRALPQKTEFSLLNSSFVSFVLSCGFYMFALSELCCEPFRFRREPWRLAVRHERLIGA